jgi:hypothetical protein
MRICILLSNCTLRSAAYPGAREEPCRTLSVINFMYPLTLFDILRAKDLMVPALCLVACGAFTLYWAVRAVY